jgi:hypothetical protein
MLPLIIGSVTIAAVGYAVKEYCEDEGCPWDESVCSSSTPTTIPIVLNTTKAKEFYKLKKSFYKPTLKKYATFIEKHQLKNPSIDITQKLQKKKFDDAVVTEELNGFMKQIGSTLEILAYNIDLKIRLLEKSEKIEESELEKLNQDLDNLYNLSHLKLFKSNQQIDKIEILSTLVKSMTTSMQKDSIPLELYK